MSRECTFIFILLLTASITVGQPASGVDFLDAMSNRSNVTAEKLSTSDESRSIFEKICPIDKSSVAKRVLREYGVMFVASETVNVPPTCQFQSDAQVASFQSKLKLRFVIVDGIQVQIQKDGADSLNTVIAEALAQGMRIRLLDGAVAAGRSYSDTVRLWNSRFEPALRYWTARNRISMDEAASVAQIPLEQQIEKVIDWEAQGMKFATGRGSSIFASTAPPGTSQHLSFIAIDIAPPLTPTVIALMNSHGWYQTVKGDRPHFTYLGLAEKDLPGRGLKALLFEGTQYWVPNIAPDPNP